MTITPDAFERLTLIEREVEARREHPDAYDFLIDPIMPKYTVHLLVGPSGAGKTTWLINMLKTWSRGDSVFSYKSNPVPWMYLSLDRTEEENIRVFTRVGVHSSRVKRPTRTEQRKKGETLLFYLGKLKTKYPEIELFIIDGFQMATPEGKVSDYGIVSTFLNEIKEFCAAKRVTVIGVCHENKTKKNEDYQATRDKTLGSVAWPSCSGLIISLAPADKDDPTCTVRDLVLLPRDAPPRTFQYDWKDGMLAEVDSKIPKFTPQQLFFQFVLAKFGMNSDNMRTTAQEIRRFIRIEKANRTWEELRKTLIDENLLIEEKKGAYRILPYDKAELQKRSGMGSTQ